MLLCLFFRSSTARAFAWSSTYIYKKSKFPFKPYPIKTPASALDTISIVDPRVLYDNTFMCSDIFGV